MIDKAELKKYFVKNCSKYLFAWEMANEEKFSSFEARVSE